MDLGNVIKVMIPAVVAFIIGILITPAITHYLYKYKAWKKVSGKTALDGTEAVVFNSLHKSKEQTAPRMGGLVIVCAAIITVLGILITATVFPNEFTLKLNFLSRDQTWIPFITLIVGALVGFIDDFLQIRGTNGLSLKRRLIFVATLSLFIGWWFYDKLAITSVGVPFGGSLEIGWLVIPLFIIISLAIYASGVIDGIDGLSGGVFAMIFIAYSVIALSQYQINLAAFSAMLVGAILAFLWFNVPPARFFMTETGTMALTLTLATIVFMTDSLGNGIGISALPIIGFLLVATVASNIIQTISKRFFNKKVFLVAPLHHHLEAIGWSRAKITMRYWILGAIFAFFGVIFALIG